RGPVCPRLPFIPLSVCVTSCLPVSASVFVYSCPLCMSSISIRLFPLSVCMFLSRCVYECACMCVCACLHLSICLCIRLSLPVCVVRVFYICLSFCICLLTASICLCVSVCVFLPCI
uniref:Syntaxin-binding protein 2 n=1 Tax=Parascaris univalens TaxID=6257 RepID=A0A915AR44_PARUN